MAPRRLPQSSWLTVTAGMLLEAFMTRMVACSVARVPSYREGTWGTACQPLPPVQVVTHASHEPSPRVVGPPTSGGSPEVASPEGRRSAWTLGGLGMTELARWVLCEIQHDDCLGQATQFTHYFLFTLFPFSLVGTVSGHRRRPVAIAAAPTAHFTALHSGPIPRHRPVIGAEGWVAPLAWESLVRFIAVRHTPLRMRMMRRDAPFVSKAWWAMPWRGSPLEPRRKPPTRCVQTGHHGRAPARCDGWPACGGVDLGVGPHSSSI